jgi:hypothetical protein
LKVASTATNQQIVLSMLNREEDGLQGMKELFSVGNRVALFETELLSLSAVKTLS